MKIAETNDFNDHIDKVEKYTNLSSDKQDAFSYNVLLLSSSIFGILISLHDNKTEHLYTRVAFLIAILLLALGILSLVIMLYDRSMLVEHMRQKYLKELVNALNKNKKVNSVFAKEGKRLMICRKISYTILLLSLFMLIIYTALSTFL